MALCGHIREEQFAEEGRFVRVLAVTAKIVDESLSSTARLNTFRTLAEMCDLHVVARLRAPRQWNPELVAWHGSHVWAPRVPGLSLFWFFLASFVMLVSESVRFRPDVVLVERGSLYVALLARLILAPFGIRPGLCFDVRTLPMDANDLRATFGRVADRLSLRLVGRNCEVITAITPGAARWLSPKVGVPVEEIVTWSTGVDASHYDPAIHAPIGWEPGEVVRFLYHGVVYSLRGLDTLVDAARILRDRGNCRFAITILGSGPSADALRSHVDRLDLGQFVEIVGAVTQAQVPDAIAAHHVGVIPLPDLESWNTSSPTKLFECMSMERPLVLTSIEAHTAVVGDEPYVLWAEPSNPVSLADALEEACGGLPELLEAAQRARARVLAEFTWERQVAVFCSALERAAEVAHTGNR